MAQDGAALSNLHLGHQTQPVFGPLKNPLRSYFLFNSSLTFQTSKAFFKPGIEMGFC